MPPITTDDDSRSTTTEATGAGGRTSTSADPDAPSAEAVIRVDPAAMPVTIPLLTSIAAMVGSALDQATCLLPLSVTPDEFLSVTFAGTDWPIVRRFDVKLTAISAMRSKALTPAVESLLHATTATTATHAASLRAPISIFNGLASSTTVCLPLLRIGLDGTSASNLERF
ncbi:MAG TPA: hypothetical protein VN650_14690 [Gemmatimonadaceae bacterium]|nr:hypothetical protein [Gemmatimonadaceae bacterium]